MWSYSLGLVVNELHSIVHGKFNCSKKRKCPASCLKKTICFIGIWSNVCCWSTFSAGFQDTHIDTFFFFSVFQEVFMWIVKLVFLTTKFRRMASNFLLLYDQESVFISLILTALSLLEKCSDSVLFLMYKTGF